jgi:hypothetical protein
MSSTKFVAVIGAIGTQGSSVMSTFLCELGWRVRGISQTLLVMLPELSPVEESRWLLLTSITL